MQHSDSSSRRDSARGWVNVASKEERLTVNSENCAVNSQQERVYMTMLGKHSVVNYCLLVNSRASFLSNGGNVSIYNSRNVLYVGKNNVNYAKVFKRRNFFFVKKNMSYFSELNLFEYGNNNSPRIFVRGKNENGNNMPRGGGPWRVRMFSSGRERGNGEDDKGSSASSKGSSASSRNNDSSDENGGRQNMKENFFKLKNPFRVSFEKKWSTNLEGISIKDVYRILKKERSYLAVALLCLLISSLGQMFFPMCISKIINMYGGKEESLKYVMNEVYKTVFLILGISTFSFCRIYFIETSIEKITRRLRKSLFEKILSQKLNFFDIQKTGELINRLSNDIEISSRILIHLSFGIRNLIAALIGGICALHISPSKLFHSFLLPVSAALLIGTSYGKFVKRISIDKQEKLSNCIDFASEKIHNIANVRLLNGESFEKKEFTKYLDEVYKAGTKFSLIKAGNHFLFFSIISLFLLHLIYYGNYLILNKFINTGDLFSLIMYSLFCGSGIQGVLQSVGDLQKCVGSCSKVLQIIKLPSSEFNDKWIKNSINFLKNGNFDVRFDNVSFSYQNDLDNCTNTTLHGICNTGKEGLKNYALKNVSFHLPHNKSVAIVGKSGSGKTTILNLLSKRNETKSGKIFIGNLPIDKINSSALRSILGIVTQNPFLFNISVKSNLLYPYKAHEQMLKEQIELFDHMETKEKLNNRENYLWRDGREKCSGITTNGEVADGAVADGVVADGAMANGAMANGAVADWISANTGTADTETDYDRKEIYTYLIEQMKQIRESKRSLIAEKLQNVYTDFHMHDFLSNNPNYDNISVGVDGSFLSGGQKQRVYLAQNLCKNNKILILDEPTSSLDKLSEQIINKALLKYMKGKTTIIFTHRLDLLQFVDYIGVLNDGTMLQFDLRATHKNEQCSSVQFQSGGAAICIYDAYNPENATFPLPQGEFCQDCHLTYVLINILYREESFRKGINCRMQRYMNGRRRFYFSLPCSRELKNIVKLQLLEREDKDKIINIWKEKYKNNKYVIADHIGICKYELIKKNCKNNCHFIIPYKNQNGYINFYSQFIDTKLVFITPLEGYNKFRSNSVPYVTLNFFDELKNKEIVLTKLNIINNTITKDQAKKFYMYILSFYSDFNYFQYVGILPKNEKVHRKYFAAAERKAGKRHPYFDSSNGTIFVHVTIVHKNALALSS
ncbi:ABC transporter B family member 7, putative (ABCB7) [Plasmodium ovale curtisi]|uniref:ABC transporter B family member 7, putative (ABCB7) n=1 Tax=Plasmodium ovale curtisi TaxID=864141 RepID=A0A1A8W504_PLAOA|nr:ABC transporter B family member 7, putative (ABCB7) [Plasmodium ovale curtisi]